MLLLSKRVYLIHQYDVQVEVDREYLAMWWDENVFKIPNYAGRATTKIWMTEEHLIELGYSRMVAETKAHDDDPALARYICAITGRSTLYV